MLSQQKTHKRQILISHHRRFSHGTGQKRGTEEVMECDDSSDASSNTWSNRNWNSWKTNWDSSRNVTPTLRIEDYNEAPPLFPELVLASFFSRNEEWTPNKREAHDTGSDKKHTPTGQVGTSLEDTVSRWRDTIPQRPYWQTTRQIPGRCRR